MNQLFHQTDTGKTLYGIKIFTDPDIEDGMVYFMNTDNFAINYPKRKDGKPDMRYGVNKLERMFREMNK